MTAFYGEVHPLAEQWPMMTESDLLDLADDIRANGLRQPIVIDRQGRLVDGRNRLAACRLAVVQPRYVTPATGTLDSDEQIAAFIDSANLHRRHLTREQKRDILAARIKAEPEKSDRQHAEALGVSPSTAGEVRRRLEESGDVSKLDTRTDSLGRSQPAHVTTTTRTTEATKVERAVDMATGEILGETVTDEVWAAESRPSVEEFLDSDADVQDARYRANLSKVVAQVSILPKYDPERVADLLDADGWYALELVMKSAHDWHQKIAARRRRSPLTLIGGSK